MLVQLVPLGGIISLLLVRRAVLQQTFSATVSCAAVCAAVQRVCWLHVLRLQPSLLPSCLAALTLMCRCRPLLQTAAEAVGKKVAELCAEKQISKVCFDRGGFAYHGRIEVRRVAGGGRARWGGAARQAAGLGAAAESQQGRAGQARPRCAHSTASSCQHGHEHGCTERVHRRAWQLASLPAFAGQTS